MIERSCLDIPDSLGEGASDSQKLSLPPIQDTFFENLEKELLKKRSYGEKFVDWVHQNPEYSMVIMIVFFWMLLLPTISILVALLSHNSERPIKTFINKFIDWTKLAKSNNFLNEYECTELTQAINQLSNPQIKKNATDSLRELQQTWNQSILQQKEGIKERFLDILNDAPPTFILQKEDLRQLLQVNENDKGELLLVFVINYDQTKEFYSQAIQNQLEYKANWFATFVCNVFNLPVKLKKETGEIGSSIERRHTSFSFSVVVDDIYKTPANQEILNRYYQAFEVKKHFEKAISDWVLQQRNSNTGDEHTNKCEQLAKNIADTFKVTVNQGGIVTLCSYVDFGLSVDTSASLQHFKEEMDKKKRSLSCTQTLIDNLKIHLNQVFGSDNFTLTYEFKMDTHQESFEIWLRSEVTLTAPQDAFERVIKHSTPKLTYSNSLFSTNKPAKQQTPLSQNNDVESLMMPHHRIRSPPTKL